MGRGRGSRCARPLMELFADDAETEMIWYIEGFCVWRAGMAENKYFNQALSGLAFDLAGGGAIRHLADKGYTVKQILKELDCALPAERVRQAVWDRLVEQEVLLLEEPGMGADKGKAVFVEERGKFGKTSFRRVVLPGEQRKRILWKETGYKAGNDMDYKKLLAAKCMENGSKTAYVSCDFGVWERKEPGRYLRLMDLLEERQREYIEGFSWIGQRVYHRMDARMTEIAGRMFGEGQCEGACYFMELGEKMVIGKYTIL